jgi:hypothetical protein
MSFSFELKRMICSMNGGKLREYPAGYNIPLN